MHSNKINLSLVTIVRCQCLFKYISVIVVKIFVTVDNVDKEKQTIEKKQDKNLFIMHINGRGAHVVIGINEQVNEK